jgi:hypothetical protein
MTAKQAGKNWENNQLSLSKDCPDNFHSQNGTAGPSNWSRIRFPNPVLQTSTFFLGVVHRKDYDFS